MPSLQQLDLDHVTPATRLLEKRRQMFEVQEALEAQKEEFARREELFKRREEQLRKKDVELQESLIRFNKFLQENDSKRARAERKAQDEVRQKQQKDGELEGLREQLAALTIKKDKMKKTVEQNLIYMRYLERTLETTEDYSEIPELLVRYETLTAHHDDLQAWSTRCAQLADECRLALQAANKEGQDTKLKSHNEVAALQKTLEVEQVEAMKEMGRVDRRLEESADRTLALGKIQWAIENLYERCRQRSKVKIPKSEDITKRLKGVQDFFVDLAFIVRNAGGHNKDSKRAAGEDGFSEDGE